MIRMALLALTLILAACKPAVQPKAEPADTPQAGKAQPAPRPDQPAGASALLLREETPDLRFSWQVPREVGLIPPLLRWMRAEAERTLAKARKTAAEDKATRPADLPFTGHFYDEKWAVESDTPRLLSLRGTIELFTGGAHGSQTFASILWDKAAGRRIAFSDLFTAWPEARAVLTPLYCAELDKERARRRNGETLGGEFDACPPLDDQPITLVGGSESMEAIRVRLAPDTAGPYAEGGYELTVRLPEAALGLVRPDYRADFSIEDEKR